LGAVAGFCVDCSIDFGLPCSVRLIRAQPHAARVRSWPWAKLTIAWALGIEQVTEEQDRASKKGLGIPRRGLLVIVGKNGDVAIVDPRAQIRSESIRLTRIGNPGRTAPLPCQPEYDAAVTGRVAPSLGGTVENS